MKQGGDARLYGRLLGQAKPYWPHLSGLLVLSLLATPLALLTPLPLKIAVDSVLGSDPLPGFLAAVLPPVVTASDQAMLVAAAVLLILIVLLSQLQSLASTLIRTYTGERITLEFRIQLFRHVQRLSLAFHDTRGTS